MRITSATIIVFLSLGAWISFPNSASADNDQSYIDQLGRQIAKDMKSGEFKEKVKPVDNSPAQPTAPAQPQQPSIKHGDEEGNFWFSDWNEAHLARFFGTLLGPDEFATNEFWEGSNDDSGDYLFGDSVRNPTALDLFGSGSGRVLGPDTGFIRPQTLTNSTLRDEINANDFDSIRSSLTSLGFGNGDFRIERY